MESTYRDMLIENALRGLHDAVLDALEQNPRIKMATKIVLKDRLEEAQRALHAFETPVAQ